MFKHIFLNFSMAFVFAFCVVGSAFVTVSALNMVSNSGSKTTYVLEYKADEPEKSKIADRVPVNEDSSS